MSEAEAIAVAIQLCQAVSFVHRRGLRVNDICPESVVRGADGRIKLTGLDCVSNDNELQSEPIFNDGYTAPEIYKAQKVDKRADIFSVGALLYTCLTGSGSIPNRGARKRGRFASTRRTWCHPRWNRRCGARCSSTRRRAGPMSMRSRPNWCGSPGLFGCARRS